MEYGDTAWHDSPTGHYRFLTQEVGTRLHGPDLYREAKKLILKYPSVLLEARNFLDSQNKKVSCQGGETSEADRFLPETTEHPNTLSDDIG